MKKDSVLKLVVISLIGVVVLCIIQAVFLGDRQGFGFTLNSNFGGEQYRGGMYVGNGLYYGGTLTYLLLILIKILFALFVLGFVVGLVIWIKNNIFTIEERQVIKDTFTGKRPVVKKEVCRECGRELNAEWKVCPFCGVSKEVTTNNINNA